ncbi:glycosyltransferase [Salipiger bermudensis]|uniref:glycosyltransferase family 2 protein n=1 Tax=Salipiger bermudensis TaxID=344736 RepID=UPI001C9A07E3|nr:glycosyltransferase [Salipiger bermudensis]MBY6004235.1 glycosyltransferase [Salipiger bermudensis]
MSGIPEISVIINNYNYGQYLPDAINSALEQQDVNAEVIVVDDGSTDSSHCVISALGARIRPHFQANGGQASAINAGVALAQAPIMAFLDADDWFLPGKLRAVLDAFAANPEAGLVYHRLQPTRPDGSHAFAPIPRTLCRGDLAPRLAQSGGRWPFPMTSSLAVRRSCWDEAGNIPKHFAISADAWLTGVLPFLTPVVALPQPLACYRIHDNAWYRAKDDQAMLSKRMSHWEITAQVTNEVLAARGRDIRVSIEDNFAYQVAAARLGQIGAPGLMSLAFRGLADTGEPNLLRRVKHTMGALADVMQDSSASSAGTRTQ